MFKLQPLPFAIHTLWDKEIQLMASCIVSPQRAEELINLRGGFEGALISLRYLLKGQIQTLSLVSQLYSLLATNEEACSRLDKALCFPWKSFVFPLIFFPALLVSFANAEVWGHLATLVCEKTRQSSKQAGIEWWQFKRSHRSFQSRPWV